MLVVDQGRLLQTGNEREQVLRRTDLFDRGQFASSINEESQINRAVPRTILLACTSTASDSRCTVVAVLSSPSCIKVKFIANKMSTCTTCFHDHSSAPLPRAPFPQNCLSTVQILSSSGCVVCTKHWQASTRHKQSRRSYTTARSHNTKIPRTFVQDDVVLFLKAGQDLTRTARRPMPAPTGCVYSGGVHCGC